MQHRGKLKFPVLAGDRVSISFLRVNVLGVVQFDSTGLIASLIHELPCRGTFPHD